MSEQSTFPTTTSKGPPIIVGVGPDEVSAALEFAAAEALRVGCGLHLVHSVQLVGGGPESVLVAAVDADKIGGETLDLAAERAEHLVGGAVPVTRELRRGAPVQALVSAGHEARMVVLEHRHLSRLSRVVNRTVAGGVAAHLRVPVVAVPSGWTRPTGSPVVVAGIDVPQRSEEVLRAATAEASARGASLRLVHSWPAPVGQEALGVDERSRWADRSRAEVRAALDDLGDLTRAMDAEVRVMAGRPVESLLGALDDAELLVIGRHDPLIPIGSHIGPVARAVLREATCPVLLATPHPHRAAYRP